MVWCDKYLSFEDSAAGFIAIYRSTLGRNFGDLLARARALQFDIETHCWIQDIQ